MRTAKTADSKIPSALVFLAGVLLVPCFCFATDSDYVPPHLLTEENPTSVHQFVYHIKRDETPVGILIKDVTFSIPRNYLASLYKVADYTSVSFTILTFYPDFAGSTTSDDGGEIFPQTKEWRFRKWRWMASPNLIEITGLGHDEPKQNMQSTYVLETEKDEPDHAWKYGLLKSTKSPGAQTQNIYFRRPSKTDAGTVLFCSNYADLDVCAVYLRLTPHVEIFYKFHQELLPHWQEINQKVTKLIQSFIVKKE